MGSRNQEIVWLERFLTFPPYALKLSHFKNLGYKHIPSYGPLPVTVPGCVDGWFEFHEKLGRLSMPDILAPAIAYAREGFPVTHL